VSNSPVSFGQTLPDAFLNAVIEPAVVYRSSLQARAPLRLTSGFDLADNPRRIVGFIDAPWAPEYADALWVEAPEANWLMFNHGTRYV
jgi:hypothetical protein